MSDTPETDACWDDKECNILEHARQLERDRDGQCRLLGMSAERECGLRWEMERERAIADRLADCLNNLWHHHSLTEASYDYIDKALAAWKEARSECR
jgi:1,6-anhydro-N-acetylmuramate kinase